MKTTIFFSVLLCASCVTFAAFIRQTTDCAQRGTVGLICSQDCKDVATCLKDGDKWMRVEIESCTGNQTCNLLEKGCSDKPSQCYSIGEMNCHRDGVYPDPYDFQRYYYCVKKGAKSEMRECGKDKAYNAKSYQCDMKITDEIFKEALFKCENPGDVLPWEVNKNLYYVCKYKDLSPDIKRVLYPELFRCEDGQEFDPTEGCKPV